MPGGLPGVRLPKFWHYSNRSSYLSSSNNKHNIPFYLQLQRYSFIYKHVAKAAPAATSFLILLWPKTSTNTLFDPLLHVFNSLLTHMVDSPAPFSPQRTPILGFIHVFKCRICHPPILGAWMKRMQSFQTLLDILIVDKRRSNQGNHSQSVWSWQDWRKSIECRFP